MAVGNTITPIGNNGMPLEAFQIGASQNVNYAASGGSSAQSTALGAATTMILVAVNIGTGNGVRIAISSNPTADGTTTLLPASGVYRFYVQPGWKVAVLSNDSNTGSVNVTEVVNWG